MTLVLLFDFMGVLNPISKINDILNDQSAIRNTQGQYCDRYRSEKKSTVGRKKLKFCS
jgi:hypothetical protein